MASKGKKLLEPSTCAAVALAVAVLLPLLRLLAFQQPLLHVLPNLFLLVPAPRLLAQVQSAVIDIDTAIVRPPTPIPEIEAEEYSYERLRRATGNWRSPAVIRGFFKDSKALALWTDVEYLSGRLGKYEVPTVKNSTYGSPQDERSVMPFGEALREIMVDHSPRYMFFPVQSRQHLEHTTYSTEDLQRDIDTVVREDLELDRIFPGFGTESHKAYHGSQLVIGYGQKDLRRTTGTGWHCAPGNNWFAQVAGRKRWYFVDPKDSQWMYPARNGLVSFQTQHVHMQDLQSALPVGFVDLEAGDLLYNPDWQWHSVHNYDGLSMGVPIREFIPRVTFGNNALFTSIIIVNRILNDAFGIDLGGYANPASGEVLKEQYMRRVAQRGAEL